MRRLTSGTHQQDPSKDLQRDSEHVLGILVAEKLSTCCDKLVSYMYAVERKLSLYSTSR